MRLGQDSAEQIRCHELSRALKKVDLSPEEEEVIERLSRSLVGKLLHGPISRVMASAEVELSFGWPTKSGDIVTSRKARRRDQIVQTKD